MNEQFTVKIDNLDYRVSKDDLQERFGKFGEIGDIYIPRHPGSGENRGFGFVRFVVEADAEDAVRDMDGKDFEGREIRAAMAEMKKSDSRRSFNDRGGGYGRDRRG